MIRRYAMCVRVVGVSALTVSACGLPPDEEFPVEVPITEAHIDLSIGVAEGAGPDVFGRVGGVLILPDGRIVVSDIQSHEVRVFDTNGAHLFTFGREGEGPGDLGAPCCLALDREGLLWVRETMNGRYSAFEIGTEGASFVRTVRQQHGAMGLMAPLTFDAEGRLVDVGERVSPSGGASERVRYHLGAASDIQHTDVVVPTTLGVLGRHQVERQTPDGHGTFYLWQPYASHAVSAHGPDGRWARAVTGRYEIVSWDGLVFDTLRGSARTGPALTPEEREAGQEAMQRDAERVGIRVADLPYDLPERRTPISQLFYDDLGRLWVELNVARGEPRLADVWGVDGDLESRVSWPAGVRLGTVSWIGERHALGVMHDELGVERVVRLRFD